jgi:RNA polymerase sigma factor for flagellar operon FliA
MTIHRPSSPDVSPPQQDEEGNLWAAFKVEGSVRAREKLFSKHAPFARNIARRHHHEQSRGDIDFADLQQFAYTGLLEALDRFDLKYCTPFRPYAAHRISGSVQDGIAKTNEVREQISWRNRLRRERLLSLSQETPASANTAGAVASLADIAVGLALGFMLEGTGLFDQGVTDRVTPTTNTNAYDSIAWKQTVRRLEDALSTLPEREQTILRQHYLNGVSFDHLVSLLGISKGRISQLHRAALLLLKKRMREQGHFRLER